MNDQFFLLYNHSWNPPDFGKTVTRLMCQGPFSSAKVAWECWDVVFSTGRRGRNSDPRVVLNISRPQRFCVNGRLFENEESDYAADGQFGPFVIFDIDAQDNIPGHYPTREAAEEICRLLNSNP